MTPSQTTYLILIICAVGAVAMIIGLWVAIALFRLVQDLRGKPPHPPNEQIQQSYEQLVRDHKETRARVIAIENWRAGLSNQLSESESSILKEGQSRETRLLESIDAVRQELDGKISALAKQVTSLPEEIVQLFTNIKKLGEK